MHKPIMRFSRGGGALALVAIVLLGGCAGAQRANRPADPLEPLAWMSGEWVGTIGDGEDRPRNLEYWSEPIAGDMFGINRTIRGDEDVAFEYLRIVAEPSGEIVYLAQLGGQSPATRFELVELADRRAVFANPEHDFPTHIEYWREGNELHARVMDPQGEAGRVIELRWTREE